MNCGLCTTLTGNSLVALAVGFSVDVLFSPRFFLRSAGKKFFTDNCRARVVRKVDNAISRINHYPADSMACFVNTYPLDSYLYIG